MCSRCCRATSVRRWWWRSTRVKAGRLPTACLTNNVVGGDPRADVADVMARFDQVVESSKVGVRKPEPRFYEIACELLAVEPAECVFLDDLGINLKPAAAMGMTTIKVVSRRSGDHRPRSRARDPPPLSRVFRGVGYFRHPRPARNTRRREIPDYDEGAVHEVGEFLVVDGLRAGGRAARLDAGDVLRGRSPAP